MKGICGTDCDTCQYGKDHNCKGCKNTNGCPFGKQCFIAKYILTGGEDSFNTFRYQLIDEINELKIPGMRKIDDLYPMNGYHVNMEFPMQNGKTIELLDDDEIYLCNQIRNDFSDKDNPRYYGIACNMSLILICEFDELNENPELILYKKR